MTAADDATTLGSTRLSFANAAEIAEFADTLARFERGEISSAEWRSFRLVRGTYGQRQSGDVQMLRVKIPQGVLGAAQLRALGDVADAYSRGFGHVTTRQNLQFHFLKLHHVAPAMERLALAGLTTREACGNAVRNITACPYAGVAADELFDVTPYAEALTRHLLRHPLSSALPRKFKLGFEGCPRDHALTAINDLGFRAALRGGLRGFRVTVGGGTAILCRSGFALVEFLPAGELLALAEAVLEVFDRCGDRAHRQRNRLKFLIQNLGAERWRAEFEAAFTRLRGTPRLALAFDPQAPPEASPPRGTRPLPPPVAAIAAAVAATSLRGPGILPAVAPPSPALAGEYAAWARSNLRPQRQPGFALATIRLPLGDVTGVQLRVLAELAQAYGDGTVRTTPEQNLVLRHLPLAEAPELHRRLQAAGLARAGAGTLEDVTSCPGAEACRIAVTQSRGLAELLGEHLRARPELAAAAPGVDVKISGCPNGCGQHHVAGIGFQGSVRRLGSRVVPQYFVLLGGGTDSGGARFGRLAAKVPARRVGQVIERLIALYVAERSAGETAAEFLRRAPLDVVKALLADLEAITLETAVAEDFVDLGEQAEFVVETQAGECVA